MIWATVSSRSCFCWPYRASHSLAAKNISNLNSVLTIWWCPCVVFSCVVGRGCLLWPVRSLGKTLLAFALLHSVPQGQIYLLLQVSLDFLLLHSSPLRGLLFWILVLEGLVGLHTIIQFQLLQHYWPGQRLGLLWYWMVCLEITEIILSFLRLYPSTACGTLLLTMMATPFLRTSFPQ